MQHQCPHCSAFKVIETEFRYDATKKNKVANQGCLIKTTYIVVGIVGVMGLCQLAFEDVRMIGVILLVMGVIVLLPAAYMDRDYKSHAVGHDYECSVCGYKWTVPKEYQ